MRKASRLVIGLVTAFGLSACGGSQAPAEAPSSEAKPEPAAEPAPTSGEPAKRAELTAQACESSGGSVVGDIGDGATQRADYTCPGGAKPTGNIRAAEGGPIGVEGSVCCPK